MMWTAAQPGGWRLGPSLAGGLTLRYYPAFRICSTLPRLKRRIAAELPDYDRWGILLLVSEISSINPRSTSLRYAQTFLQAPGLEIAQRWHGVYSTHPEKPFLSLQAGPGVRIVTATGGSGMTLSFALVEKTLREMEN